MDRVSVSHLSTQAADKEFRLSALPCRKVSSSKSNDLASPTSSAGSKLTELFLVEGTIEK
jgi:hypothetical protein